MNWTFSINVFCSKCQQKITEQDFSQNNYQLILLPVFTLHHQVCPRNQPESSFTYPFAVPEKINLNINLK